MGPRLVIKLPVRLHLVFLPLYLGYTGLPLRLFKEVQTLAWICRKCTQNLLLSLSTLGCHSDCSKKFRPWRGFVVSVLHKPLLLSILCVFGLPGQLIGLAA